MQLDILKTEINFSLSHTDYIYTRFGFKQIKYCSDQDAHYLPVRPN